MMYRWLLLGLVVLSLLGAAPPPLDSPILSVSELFPAEPGINTQRGFAVAVAGEWLAMGARLDDEAGENAGAVYLFKWSGTAWEQRAKLLPSAPTLKNAQFGLSLALRGDVLAVGAPGQGAVYVYLFDEDEGVWFSRAGGPLRGAPGFGRSLALNDAELAVGAGDGHGREAGAVYLYRGPSWDLETILRPRRPQKGERFGHAVALIADLLVVGAPGYDLGPRGQSADAGAAYVFERPAGGVWQETQRLRATDSGSRIAWELAGDQFGFAVATNGSEIVVGAPTAGLAGTNSGALYRFGRGPAGWIGRGLVDAEDHQAGDQLGFSLALSGDLLAAGFLAPPAAPPATAKSGGIRVFRFDGAAWRELDFEANGLTPGNAEVRDLAGFAVAVDAGRVVAGGVLGDQGSGAAGASWSFFCRGTEASTGFSCSEEGEAEARDLSVGEDFGVSVALTEPPATNDGVPPALLAVGAPRDEGANGGAVYLYRRAGREGWRQEERLLSPHPGDGFGSSVAFDSSLADGPLLAVGAPQGFVLPVSPPTNFGQGYVEVYSRQRGSWAFEVGFVPGNPNAEETVGTALALENGVLAIGAPRGSQPGGVYVVEKRAGIWQQTDFLAAPLETPVPQAAAAAPAGDGFGSSLSLRGDLLVIGAPGADGGAGAVYVSSRAGERWRDPVRLAFQDNQPSHRFGAAVAVGEGTIAVGAPDVFPGFGKVYLFEGAGGSWRNVQVLTTGEHRHFGSSLALLGNRLLVGAPGDRNEDRADSDHAVLYERRNGEWTPVAELDAVDPPIGDEFGTAVALSKRFLAVTSPKPALPPRNQRSGRVTLFDLAAPSPAGETP